jgi:putative ABC transport system permease protein
MAIPIKYNIRSVMVRRTGTLMAVLSVAATVAVFISILALAGGLESAFTATGDKRNLIVIRQGSQVESNSSVDHDQVQTIKYLNGVAKDAHGDPLVSAELLVLVLLPRAGGEKAHLLMRGVSPAGLLLRPQVTLVEGRMFKTGLREVVVSRTLAKRFAMELGQPLRIEGGTIWTVVGLLDGHGTAYESEIWTDINALSDEFKRDAYSSVLLRAESDSSAVDIVKRINDDNRLKLQAFSEVDYFKEQTKASAPIKYLGSFISVIMAVGACFAAMNAMYASVAYRAREIGTLRVLGFQRRYVLLAFVMESVFLAVVGGMLGCLLALPVHGISTGTMNFSTFSELAFQFRITPKMFGEGILFAVFMGMFGGLFPAMMAARRPIVQSLRA